MEIKRISAAIRYEDSQFFGEVDGYQHDRAEDIRDELNEAFEKRMPGEYYLQLLGEWVSRCISTGAQTAPPFSHKGEPGTRLEVSVSPAFILRPRSKVMLAEAYKRISRELRDPGTPLPVALVSRGTSCRHYARQRARGRSL